MVAFDYFLGLLFAGLLLFLLLPMLMVFLAGLVMPLLMPLYLVATVTAGIYHDVRARFS